MSRTKMLKISALFSFTLYAFVLHLTSSLPKQLLGIVKFRMSLAVNIQLFQGLLAHFNFT